MKKLVAILDNNKQVDEYKITELQTTSTELFFIKEELQMNRAKDVTHTIVTIYKNFTEDGKKYKGSSQTKISPTNSESEIEEKINQAVLAASFVKNEYYTLVSPTFEKAPTIKSAFAEGDIISNIKDLVSDLYEEDNQFGSFINSTEFFIDQNNTRIINSNGVDVSFTTFRGEIELISEANGKDESIELYEVFKFSDYDKKAIKKAIIESLENASLRANAVPMPNVSNIPVILRGSASVELWNYYSFCTSGAQIYEHLHSHKIGDNVQGNDVKGDRITISRKPNIPNSTASRYYDGDGVYLQDVLLLEKGVIKNFLADKRISDYLQIPCTGGVGNIVVDSGSYSEDDLRDGPYLEIISFSAFQSDPLTGFFGGEFRLGLYFDGKTKIPVTQGSISANIKDAQKEMYLSKSTVKANNFIGPEFVKFSKVNIAGK